MVGHFTTNRVLNFEFSGFISVPVVRSVLASNSFATFNSEWFFRVITMSIQEADATGDAKPDIRASLSKDSSPDQVSWCMIACKLLASMCTESVELTCSFVFHLVVTVMFKILIIHCLKQNEDRLDPSPSMVQGNKGELRPPPSKVVTVATACNGMFCIDIQACLLTGIYSVEMSCHFFCRYNDVLQLLDLPHGILN